MTAMLKLQFDDCSLLFPWSTARTTDIDFINLSCCIVEKNELWIPQAIRPPTGQIDLTAPFQVFSGRFGAPLLRGDFHPSVRSFIGILKKAGVRPEFKRQNGVPRFSFFFNVSLKNHKAYYVLTTPATLFGQNVTRFVVEMYCDSITSEIVENVKRLDEVLYALIRLCKVPEAVRAT
jgi:hypothetical protein